MINVHDLIAGGMIGWPLMIIAFVLVYYVFLRDPDDSHKEQDIDSCDGLHIS